MRVYLTSSHIFLIHSRLFIITSFVFFFTYGLSFCELLIWWLGDVSISMSQILNTLFIYSVRHCQCSSCISIRNKGQVWDKVTQQLWSKRSRNLISGHHLHENWPPSLTFEFSREYESRFYYNHSGNLQQFTCVSSNVKFSVFCVESFISIAYETCGIMNYSWIFHRILLLFYPCNLLEYE